jgi:hypothetical protein
VSYVVLVAVLFQGAFAVKPHGLFAG